MNASKQDITPRFLDIRGAVTYSGIGRTLIYRAIKAGTIKAVKHGKRTLVDRASIDAYLDNLEPFKA